MNTTDLNSFSKSVLPVKRVLLSVTDKAGLESFAGALNASGAELISTGGTAARLRSAGLKVRDVSEITGFPECLDGRVKTLHPSVHGGILARKNNTSDMQTIQDLEIKPFDLIVVNLYPFRETIARPGCSVEEAIENIDIGGPAMIRAAAKNFDSVCVVTSPDQYEILTNEIDEFGGIRYETRLAFAREAFSKTAQYDSWISTYLGRTSGESLPERLTLAFDKSGDLRYGENPHQAAGVYGIQHELIDCFHGKQLSYNNYLDVEAALNLAVLFKDDEPTCIIIKHTNPCGIATAGSLTEAWLKAFETDKNSPFGGIVIVNRILEIEAARAIDTIFTEIILAPAYSEDALELLKAKANRRLIIYRNTDMLKSSWNSRGIFGGILYQQSDLEDLEKGSHKTVTERRPTPDELRDMEFAWKVVRRVSSNAIVFARNRQTLGIGGGQTSRVESSRIAVEKAAREQLDLRNSVIASDAFFPFADGIEAAARAGATAVIQPGGSMRDQEVIDAANRHGMAMVFTGRRHFRH
ncbi:MAG: bifunctional phosphoribosylaminoimidazolecarboxamide formyltransferase/IMP cyclohydrolase [Rhodothermaceae bacterium]|nr:bifunctional phosphoribosylaminoimidazolecarboxamide formyltransferase/IMP cyclohydrolase [Rhodothermaceae bacterium]